MRFSAVLRIVASFRKDMYDIQYMYSQHGCRG